MAYTLAGAALLLALERGVATAATITVTTNEPRIVSDGQCSLIEAIINANNDAATHTDCAAGSGSDTIVLPTKSNITISNPYGAIYDNSLGLPSITSAVTIEGNGTTIRRHENAPAFGLMAVANSGNLTLSDVALSGGSALENGGGAFNFGTLAIKKKHNLW